MKKFLISVMALVFGVTAMAQSDYSVNVVYSDDTATVSVGDSASQYLTVTQQGAHVSIVQGSDLASEITYNLSGTSTDGGFYMAGSYKATVELNGLTLTNVSAVYSGAAVHIQNGKRINVKVVTGTDNTLVDAASGSQKGCLYIKGHAEFKQYGTLNVVGNVKHAIKAGEYITLKNATLNVTSAAGDGISCNQYFMMESGTINISGTEDDGIQCDIDGDASTGEQADHEDEDSGNIYISGGTITINCAGIAAKGIKSAGDIFINDEAVIDVTTTGKGMWDTVDLETKAACCISADRNITIDDGTLTLTATGSGGKGMKCDSVLIIRGGDITISTSGGLYYNNGSTENTNYTGNTDHISSSYYSSPKGIKAGLKTENGNSNTYSGAIVIHGGKIKVTTTGTNGEGIESKNTLDIYGGEIYVNSYDDGINSAQNMLIFGGYVYAHSNNNDGVDANGNLYINGGLVYAIGARSPELAIDANSEEGKKVYINGGVVIAVGGIENSRDINQPYIQSSSISSNSWYTVTYGDNAVAFKTPTISTGGGPGGGPGGPGGNSSATFISAPTTPSLATGNNITGGTSFFEGNCYVDDNGNLVIEEVECMEHINDPRVFTIDGRYLGTEVPTTFKGIYIQNGKKHIKIQ